MLIRRYLLSSAAYAPPKEGGAQDTPEDERVEITDDDDETPGDPVDTPEDAEADDVDAQTDDAEDDAEPDDAEPDEAPVGDGTVERPSRGNRAIGELRAERRRLAEENARLTRQMDDLRRTQPPAPVETPQQRAERLALLSPEERIREEVTEAIANNDRKNQQVFGQLLDNTDRSSFEARASANPLFKKLQPEVERRLADLRRTGQNLPRETIAIYLIGERAVAAAGKARPGQQQRQQRERARPVNGGSNVQPNRQQRRGGDSVVDIERDFGDVPI